MYLCSQSPSRAKLLEKFGIVYEQKSVSFNEESITTEAPLPFVVSASSGKSVVAQKEFGLTVPLLCADTVIVDRQGKLIRKPQSIDKAREVLSSFSNSTMSIVSSAQLRTKEFSFSSLEATHYHFSSFETQDFDAYLASKQWRGKAGGCMVEGFCKKYITKVIGYESTAMGLQVETLLPWLRLSYV